MMRIFQRTIYEVRRSVSALYSSIPSSEIKYLSQLVDKDGIVIDIGANVGRYTRTFANLCPKGQVIAFEPGSWAFRRLWFATIFLRARLKVRIYQTALGSQNALMDLKIPIKESGVPRYGLAHLGAAYDEREREFEIVPVNRLDDFLIVRQLARIDLIKMDVEGWEYHVLCGALNMVQQFRPIVVIEVSEILLSSAASSKSDLFELLRSLEYQSLEILDGTLRVCDNPNSWDTVWVPNERLRHLVL